ncbi:unnamed protein product, partial [marine sediment metagenome]
EAVLLVFEASAIGQGGEVFVLDMGLHCLCSLTHFQILPK